LAALPGTLVLYYGDELGMTDVHVPLDLQVDEMSLAQPGSLGRDRARTPMPWSAEEHGGFTAPEAKPWLPLGDYAVKNVQSEQADAASVLNFWHRVAKLRSSGRIGQVGALERVLLDDQVWAFRVGDVTTVANLSSEPATADLGATDLEVVISTVPGPTSTLPPGPVTLGPWQVLVVAPRRT
jgi:glycosidase